uniref:Glycosyltransferase family 92 protein n=1 Tax=Oncorhynchus mykiss TaxID=8022 RepID=A0A8C7S7K4_ONCMY
MVYVIFTLPRSQPGNHQHLYLHHISDQSITPVNDTKHFMVGAYKEHRLEGSSVRIISIFRRDSVQPLYCVFYCGTHWANGMKAEVQMHSDHFGTCHFLFGFSPALTHLNQHPNQRNKGLGDSLITDAELAQNQTFLHIQNLVKREEEEFQFNFTVCWSNLFGDYNNVLQVTQTLEMYKLLGVQHVVVYNTSCGPDLERLLQSYTQEGFVEVVPWPINQHMNPSNGWQPSEHGGDIHYYGQLTTLNDCVYRNMYQSRYVLLNDIDEIIAPYQHQTLPQMMDVLQRQNPKAEVFLIENHIFPKSQFEPSGRFERPNWRDVPGINIMEHIYREEPDYRIYHPSKMIVRPRAVEQTSVHSVLRNFGQTVKVPPNVCHIIHVRVPLQGGLTKKELHEDKRVWDYESQLVPNVDKALEKAGLLRM